VNKLKRKIYDCIKKIVDSAAPAAHVDNLMDSQKTGCPQVTHNRLDKS